MWKGLRESWIRHRWQLMTCTTTDSRGKPGCSSRLDMHSTTPCYIMHTCFMKSFVELNNKKMWGTERVSSVELAAVGCHSHHCASTNHLAARLRLCARRLRQPANCQAIALTAGTFCRKVRRLSPERSERGQNPSLVAPRANLLRTRPLADDLALLYLVLHVFLTRLRMRGPA